MQNLKYIVVSCLFVIACKTETQLTAEKIIDKTIEVSGGENYLKANIEFDFRGKHYRSHRAGGSFQYERQFTDSIGNIKDVLNNDGFQRYVNNNSVVVIDSMIPKYSASVNSVHYFALLPYGLNDAAVNKSSLGKVTIKDKFYHKIKVTFDQEGGGEDFEDVFVYWIDTETFKVDYLAYSYIETDGVGMRFREAYNERIINGLRFVDYKNYKPIDEALKLNALDKAFESNQLKLLSKIELKNIQVN
ncbi:DUF6503 family protein [Lacinutrix iliipiscaria]|uniref:DUF6503 family protein n=1 Tax=Lacinutrix iliipiscaria TaxID=1230532 RepID=A0ABW5WPJ2_9FLAO